MYTTGYTAISLLSGLVILIVIQPDTLLARMLRPYPLRWLGRISYGAYIFHDMFHLAYGDIVDRVCKQITAPSGVLHFLLVHPSLPTAALGLVATLLLSWLSFRFFESPFLDLKERWTIR
jgi:peptidoglycan/LPS O-acetylase OafA/YrhL